MAGHKVLFMLYSEGCRYFRARSDLTIINISCPGTSCLDVFSMNSNIYLKPDYNLTSLFKFESQLKK